MKILFCSTNSLKPELGGPKVSLALTEELPPLGWTCSAVSPSDIGVPDEGNKTTAYSRALRAYLLQHAPAYDVVEYDSGHLPYPRSDFSATTLMVARVALLAHHFVSISIPRSLKENLSYWRRGTTPLRESRAHLASAQETLQQADVITLSNDDDRQALLRSGIPAEKIIVIPYGLNRPQRTRFDVLPSDPPKNPLVVFVGTFDSRKGAQDFPRLVRSILQGEPRAHFRLLGVGSNRSPAYVKAFFPAACRDRIEVVSHFPADTLPSLLADCSVGVFPSYIESFGFGVLEMLAASIPVIAYHAPGPTILLSPDAMVPRGDVRQMAAKVVHLLQNQTDLAEARRGAKKRSQDFSSTESARRTSDAYLHHLDLKRQTIRTL